MRIRTWPDWAIHLKHRLLNWICEGQIEWLESINRNQQGTIADLKSDIRGLDRLLSGDTAILNEAKKKLEEYENLPVFRPEKVFHFKNGEYFIGENKITPQQLAILKQEAGYIKRTEIWTLFENTIGEMARQTMFEKSQNFEDMKTGKAMLFNLDILKKVVENISK